MTLTQEFNPSQNGADIHTSMVESFKLQANERGFGAPFEMLLGLLESELVFQRISAGWNQLKGDVGKDLTLTSLLELVNSVFTGIIDDSKRTDTDYQISYFTKLTPKRRAIIGAEADLLGKFYQEALTIQQ